MSTLLKEHVDSVPPSDHLQIALSKRGLLFDLKSAMESYPANNVEYKDGY
jgi:hypothetical protein